MQREGNDFRSTIMIRVKINFLQIKSKDLELHMESCARRVVQCSDCKEMFLLVDESSHSQSCPDKELGCPYVSHHVFD
jgi:hypothetical protein